MKLKIPPKRLSLEERHTSIVIYLISKIEK